MSDVVLRELEVFAVEIDHAVLVLAAAEKSFVGAGIESLRDTPPAQLRAGSSASSALPARSVNRHGAIGERHVRDDLRRREHDLAVALLHLERAAAQPRPPP